jgi:hypothetical protein
MLARCTNTDGLSVKVLRELFARREAGENTDDLAAEVGKTGTTLRRAWRRVGLHAAKLVRRENNIACVPHIIYTMRFAGKSYREIAERLGILYTRENTRLLYMRLVRYCKRAGCKVPHPTPMLSGEVPSAGSP